ncbi:MAG: sulfatase [Rikenellaceae bacterium]
MRNKIICSSLLTIGAFTTTSAKEAQPQKPNVVFILADDLGWSDIGYYDGSKGFYETPNLNEISRRGMRINNFYPGGANSSPSRTNLITGMSNVRWKMYAPGALSKGEVEYMRWSVPNKTYPDEMPFESKTTVDPSATSVAEVLATEGYYSARIGKWHLGPDNQGFDEASSNGDRVTMKDLYGDRDATRQITDASLKFLDENQDRPFFLYVPFFDVHTPLTADPELVAKYEAKWESWGDKSREFYPVYAAMIEEVDRSVKRIIDKIDELGLDDNTLIIFGSDNGGVGFITDNTPLRGSKGNLYEGGIKSPAFAIWDGVIEADTETDIPFHGVDLMPTLAEVVGAKLPTNQPVDGTSYVPAFRGEEDKKLASRPLFWHYPLYLNAADGRGWYGEKWFPIYGTDQMHWRAIPSSAIQKDGWKLIHLFEYDSDELYYLPDDIGESNNLAKENPKMTKKLKKELFAWLKETGGDIPSVENPRYDISKLTK